VGPFEQEEEGTSISSDVVKVEGAKFSHPRSPDLRNDTGTAISPISGQQNKATHTHTHWDTISPILGRQNKPRLSRTKNSLPRHPGSALRH